jgi:glycosyltransferase involved in cell wall biosynthesis
LINQSFSDIEIISIDDSTDPETIKILDSFAARDERIKIIREGSRAGLADALNRGIRQAKGNIIFRADSDDIQHLDRIKLQYEFLNKEPNIDVVGSAINLIDFNGNKIGYKKYPAKNSDIIKKSCISNPIAHPTVAIRILTLEKFGFYDINYSRAEDYELWMRLLNNGIIFHNLPNALIDYRVPDIVKRDRQNWRCNFQIKLKYFSRKHIFLRLVGLVTVATFMFAPKFIQSFLYKLYINR